MSQDFDLQRYKSSMARARDAGITFEAIRDIMNDHLGEGDDTDSFGRMVERIRDLALQAAERMASGERDDVVAWLQRMARNARHWGGEENERAEIYDRLVDVFECGEHRREESE